MKEIKKKIIEKGNEITTEVEFKNPVDRKTTGMRVIQNKDCIILQKL